MSISASAKTVPPPGEYQFLACAGCGHPTRHQVLTAVNWHDGDDNVDSWEHYWTVQCLGCHSVSFCLETFFSEDYDITEEGIVYTRHMHLYPHRLVGRKPLEYGDIPDEIHTMYLEAYGAIANEHPVLAGIGLRAVLELVCTAQGATERDLYHKLEGIAKRGIVGSTDLNTLHNLRFLGNEAAHEAKPHTIAELLAGLTVIEHLLKTIYVVPEQAKAIKQRPKQH